MDTTGPHRTLTQLRKGALEFCVLAVIRDEPAYGREIAAALQESGILGGSEGTLYPLLARMRRQGVVETTWRESTTGPPRRYYTPTKLGHESLASFRETWQPFRDAIDDLLR